MKLVYIFYWVMDRAFAIQLEDGLKQAKLKVWLDYPTLVFGTTWVDVLIAGKVEAGPVIVCMSPDLIQKAWLRQKIKLAWDHKLALIPIVVQDIGDLINQYPETQWIEDEQINMIDFHRKPFDESLKTLISTLQRMTADETGAGGGNDTAAK